MAATEVKYAGPGKAALNKKRKKDALLDAALDLFTSQGVNRTSIADIAAAAKVAKGTFYLYFKDKYDIRNLLIARKASQIFKIASDAMKKAGVTGFEDGVVFVASNIMDQFEQDPTLVRFLSKNLSWGIFKNDLPLINSMQNEEDSIRLQGIFASVYLAAKEQYRNVEVMLFEIIELVSASSYSAILYHDPLPMQEMKPHLLDAIRAIMVSQRIQNGSAQNGS